MQEVSAEHFRQKLQEKESFALFIYTPMCGTCKLAERMLAVVCEALPQVEVCRMNVNTAPQIAAQWEIQSVPALLLFCAGELRERHFAMQSAGFLFERLKGLH
ncbi:thioredoxin family protein [Brevibacillus sp. GCM10020057]|uniref:thioredoxin family protein n=1 Tax=Brevibacillus sp. GCM10020057 TaxID=3317327 RepID=UPI0036285F2A